LNGPNARKATKVTETGKEAPRRAEGPRLPPRVERRIRVARAILFWEALWPVLWPPAGVGGIFLVLALFDVFAGLPLGIHWAILAGFGGLMAWMLWRGLMGFRWPDREAALRHLEQVSGLTHQPLGAYEDAPAPGTGDAALWRAHQRWVAERIRKLKLGFTSPGLASHDPYALRAAVALLLAIAFLGTSGGQMKRIAAALLPGLGVEKAFSVEAWITPPAYTGQAPIYLEDQQPADHPATAERKLVVPENSVLSLRVHGLKNAPSLEAGQGDRGRPEPLRHMGGTNYTIDTKITASTEFALTQGGRMMRGWEVDVVADRKPRIALTKPIEKTATGSLRFAYKVDDDYGVTSAEARIALVLPPQQTSAAATKAGAKPAQSRVTPPAINLPLPTLRPRDANGETYIDLTPHPWAGLPVTITLVAKDDAGQEGTALPVALVLPAREFKKPLAAAIVEQRRALALNPQATAHVARVLDDFTADADRYIDDMRVYLALRAAYWRLASAQRDSDLAGIYDLLWATALHIEDGEVSLAETDMRRARDALADALSKGASGEELDRLLAELKDAFNRYMEALAANGQMPGANDMKRFAPQDGQTIDRSDLEKMLRSIEDMTKTGARDQAKAMLQQLQAIMENMRTPQKNPGMTPQEQAMQQGVDKIGKLIDKQRELMDQTFRQGAQMGSGAEGASPGGQKGGKASMHDLKKAQAALREELAKAMRELEQAGTKAPSALGDAGNSMKSAEDRLNDQRSDRATAAQGKAISEMREGAQGLADQMMKSMAGRSGSAGGGQGSAPDPFGRSSSNGNTTAGSEVAVPDKINTQRARKIIEELRRRAGELGRPKSELDYLDRLLKRF